MCVCVCCWPPARPVCPNHEVVEFLPRTVTDPDLGSVANAYNISIPPAPPVPTMFWIVFSPPPRPISYRPSIFHRRRCFSLSLHPLPPPPSYPGAERLSTWMAPPPAGLHHSSTLPSHAERPKEFLARSCDCLPLSSYPPLCRTRPVPRSLSAPGVSPIRGSLPPSAYLHHPHSCSPPCQPRPASHSPAVPEWWSRVFLPPCPCASALPSPSSSLSLGVF